MSGETGRAGFHLLDVAALVVGYGLASLLVRAYWPASGTPDAVETVVIGIVFCWLGLAMSGPAVLLAHRPPLPASDDGPPRDSRTWAELAWMVIGFYWIGLTVLVVPVRMRGSRFLDSAVLGLFPVLASVGLWLSSPRRPLPQANVAAWTHRAGVALLLTWPFAWVALILLGKTVL
jgi:hypothetical protein